MLNDRIQEILCDFSTEVNEAILRREFKKVSEDSHTVTIEVLGEKVDIWNVEDQGTHCYRLHLPSSENLHFSSPEFNKPKTCRKILREYSEDEKKKLNSDIDKEIKKLKGMKK